MKLILLLLFISSLIAQKQIAVFSHSNTIYQVRSNPEQTLIATAGKDSTIYIRDLEGNVLQRLFGHTSSVGTIAFSADGKRIATGAYDHKAILWTVDGKKLFEITHHSNGIKDLAFSSDDKLFAIGSRDKTGSLWNMEGQLQAKLEGHTKQIKAIQIADQFDRIITAADDGAVIAWDMKGKILNKVETGTAKFYSMILSADQKRIYASNTEGTVYIWDIGFRKERKIQFHNKLIINVSISSDSRYLFAATEDGLVKIWDFFLDKEIASFKAHDSYTSGVTYLEKKKQLVTSSGDKTIKFWDLSDILVSKQNNTAFFQDKLKAMLGEWTVKTRDRTSPGKYEENEGEAVVTSGFDDDMINLTFKGRFKNEAFNFQTSLLINDSSTVEFSNIDSQHRRFNNVSGKRYGENQIGFPFQRQLRSRTLAVKYMFTFINEDHFIFESYLSTHSLEWQLTHRREYRRD